MASQPLTKPCQVVVEGRADCEFLRQLCRARGLELKVGVNFTANSLDDNAVGTGNGGFYKSLDSLIGAMKLFPGVVKGVVVMADNDSDPAGKYEFVREQVQRAGYPSAAAGVFAQGRVGGIQLSTTIYMVPSVGTQGNLESLLLSALPDGQPRQCADALVTCAHLATAGWQAHKIEEARLRAYLCGSYDRDPGRSLYQILMDAPHSPFDMSHAAFNQIEAFLRRFLTAIGE